MSAAAQAFFPRNNARRAAAELLKRVLSPAAVEAAEEAVDDALLAAARDLGYELHTFLDLMAVLEPRPRSELDAESAGALSKLAVELVRETALAGVPLEPVRRALDPMARKLPRATPGERAAVITRALQAFRPFADWAGAGMVVRALRSEKEPSGSHMIAALEAFLADLHAQGQDLYQGLARLARAQEAHAEPPSNTELLREALTLGQASQEDVSAPELDSQPSEVSS